MNVLYVHDYGSWHLAGRQTNGEPQKRALCGETPAPSKAHWASQAAVRDRSVTEFDERHICGLCRHLNGPAN